MLSDVLVESGVDSEKISSFVFELPEFAMMDSRALVENFLKPKEELKKRIDDRISWLEKSANWKPTECTLPKCRRCVSTKQRILSYRRLMVLLKELNKVETRVHHWKAESLQEDVVICRNLLNLCEWLIRHPKPVYLAIPGVSASPSYQDVLLRLEKLKVAVSAELSMYCMCPQHLFGASHFNKQFLQKFVDEAMSARKANSCYFEQLQDEESLYLFLDSDASPLHDLSFENVETIDAAGVWIREAVARLAEYDGIRSCKERELFLRVFATRYLFSRAFPKLAMASISSAKFDNNRALIRTKTPGFIGIDAKYIGNELIERPLSDLFENTSINQAPVAWLEMAQFAVSPPDVAFCIAKVHESLTIMATLQASRGNGSVAKDFFRKIPGFDDIFGLWVAAVAVSNAGNLMGISQFLSDCECLFDFIPRFAMCVTYLQASIANINGLEL